MNESKNASIASYAVIWIILAVLVMFMVMVIVMQSTPHTNIDHTTYIKNYKYESLKTTTDAHTTPTYKLKIYKQAGMKNDLPQWTYVKTIDYGEKKPNV